jgi:hypothetical protein
MLADYRLGRALDIVVSPNDTLVLPFRLAGCNARLFGLDVAHAYSVGRPRGATLRGRQLVEKEMWFIANR